MSDKKTSAGRHWDWAVFRLSVIGGLLASPPSKGELRHSILELSSRKWIHPITGKAVSFSVGTIERWYYVARGIDNPVESLATKLRSDRGGRMIANTKIEESLVSQYRDHPSWSRALHLKNLQALAEKNSRIAPVPSYSTLQRYMLEKGMVRVRKKRSSSRDGARQSSVHFQQKETRLYEAEAPGVLWHLDGHTAKSFQVLDEKGVWISPVGIANIDDHSRLICHLQWYPIENSRYLVHSTRQAFQKRGLPWNLMSDNGKAMKSTEYTEGLTRLSVQHDLTLPYTPEQNAKLERFWGTIECQFMAMLENKKGLTLSELNNATQAWVEMGYNREYHEEIRCAPIDRYATDQDRHRKCPDGETLSLAFTRQVTRRPRRFDSSVSIEGIRFDIPWQYRHIRRVIIRYSEWDLSSAWLMNPDGDKAISRILPVDLLGNSSGRRRTVNLSQEIKVQINPPDEVAPLLKKMMEDYSATGLPPAWLPTHDKKEKDDE